MDPITIQAGLQIVLQLVNAIQTAHLNGDAEIPADVWAEAQAGRRADQAKLEADIAKARNEGR